MKAPGYLVYLQSLSAKFLKTMSVSAVLTACAQPSFPESDHYENGRFKNEGAVAENKGLLALLQWKLAFASAPWPDQVDDNSVPNFRHALTPTAGAVTLINHATEFIQLENLNIITDPVFSKRVSPFSWIGPARHRSPGATFEQIPKIDIVLISHNHYDHMDLDSLREIERRDHPTFIVPLGNRELLIQEGLSRVVELDWWSDYKHEHASITLVPMQHWSSRGLRDRNRALWGGFVIQSSGFKVLFAGDTGYGNQFKAIEQKFGAMDLSLLPIGAYEPRWFMKAHHMNPDDAVNAHLDLKSKQSIGMHFGTFQLTDEAIDAPVKDLTKSLLTSRVDPERFVAPKNGHTFIFHRTSTH